LDPPCIWEQESPNDLAGVALKREGKIERTTKETSISVQVSLNGCSKDTSVETGTPFLDQFYTVLANEACMTLKIKCKGDLWVDDHHTAEDVSIAIGQCLTQALGSKAGLNRMWLSEATRESANVEVTMDLSNRPYFEHNLHETLGRQEYVDDCGNDGKASTDNGDLLSCEMLEHCLDSLVMNGRMTVHIVQKEAKEESSVADVCLCTAMAFGRALRICSMVDQRRAGATASSKGTLSV
jgi:imidazoleglycerol-phosphate dehydratase